MVEKKNNKVFGLINAHFWSQQIARFKKPGKIAMFFTPLERRGYGISFKVVLPDLFKDVQKAPANIGHKAAKNESCQ